MTSETEHIKRSLRKQKKTQDTPLYLSTGSTLLNLAISGRSDAGFPVGSYVLFVGDSDSGKTFLSMTCFAEAARNPVFDRHRLIYDGPEGGALMDVRRFFGSRVADRLEPPETDDVGAPVYSDTVQSFYYHVDDALKSYRPFVYVLDSQDCLSSREELAKFEEQKKAHIKGKTDVAGSYGDSKAKAHSSNLRKVLGPLARTGSLLIVINQTRDSFDPFEKKTYSGGRALQFYATLQLWSSQAGKIKRTVKGKQRQLGVYCKVRVKKNRVAGRDRTVVIPIYHSVGIDNIGGCVDYLVEEGIWEEKAGRLVVRGMGPEWVGNREKVIQRIESEEMEQDLIELVEQTWNDIEQACAVDRKPRYE